MNELSMTGKTILVTGASSGIGRQAAILIAKNGGTVFITGRDQLRLDETYLQLQAASHGLQTSDFQPLTSNLQPPSSDLRPPTPDLRPPISDHRLKVADLTAETELDQLITELPKLNGIVHCAGIVGPLPVKFITQTDIDRMFGINYHVPVNLTSKLLRGKKLCDGASVVFLSTIATKNPYFGGALYSSAKAALEAYSKTLALEQVAKGIRSNCLQAGLVDTPMIVSPSEDKMQEEALERYLKRYPLGIGKPEDVASAILFFLSDAAKWITGTSLILGGE